MTTLLKPKMNDPVKFSPPQLPFPPQRSPFFAVVHSSTAEKISTELDAFDLYAAVLYILPPPLPSEAGW